jgi:hypothetical protein
VLLWLLLGRIFGCLRLRRGFGWVVNAELERCGWADRHYSRPKFDADGDIVVWREAAFAETDSELGVVSTAWTSLRARGLHLIYRIPSLQAKQSWLCSPTAETCGVVYRTMGVARGGGRRKRAGSWWESIVAPRVEDQQVGVGCRCIVWLSSSSTCRKAGCVRESKER